MTLLLFHAASASAIGAVATLALWAARLPFPSPTLSVTRTLRPAPLVVAGIVSGVITAWYTGILSAAVVVGASVGSADGFWAAQRVWSLHVRRRRALGTWAGAIARLTASGSGLRGAVQVSASQVAEPLRAAAERMAALMDTDFDAALRAFAEEVADEEADFFVAALSQIAHGSAADVAASMDRLAADITRAADSAQRLDAAREDTRASARAVAAVAVAAAAFFVWMHREFLAALDSGFGEVAVAVSGGVFLLGQRLTAAMDRPEQFLRHTLPLRAGGGR